jgi:trimeric autotransporter adhesin
MNPGGSGDISITVGGDISPLEAALAAVPEAFAGITSQIDDAFAGLGVVTTDLENLAAAAGQAIAPVQALGEQLGLFAEVPLAELPEVNEQLNLFATYAGNAAAAATEMAGASEAAATANNALASSEVAAAANTVNLAAQLFLAYQAFQMLKGGIEALADAYGNLQKAQLSLGAILGDQSAANAAIDSVRQLANTLGLASESAISAQQKLAAMGISLKDIPGDLTAIADGAAAMNTSFDTAAQRFDQIVNSGTLMARGLTSIGLNVRDVAAAMGVAGVPIATLNTAFKDLDESQRAAVLSMAELTKNAGDAEKAASGVAGAWTQVSNAFKAAEAEMGKQVDGFTGLATVITGAIKVIETAFGGIVAVVKTVVDVVIATLQTLLTPLALIGQVISDVFTKNFKAIPDDIKAANGAIEDAIKSGLANIQTDVSAAGDSITKTWATVGTAGKAAIDAVLTPMQAAQSYAERLATDFQGVAAAFNAGKLTASEYTAALNALNKAQEDANNGIQNAGTALLMVENSYRELTVAAKNAATEVGATAAAVDAGKASWTQYVTALEALNKAQEAANDGLEQLDTAIKLVSASFYDAAIAVANAQTSLAAVVNDMAAGDASATQYAEALKALDAAQRNINGGFQDAHTAYMLAVDDFRQLNVAATNATTWLQAVWQAYQEGKTGIEALTAATNAYIAAQTKLNGGALDQASAALQVASEYQTLETNLANAQTLLGQVQAGLDNGTASYGQYQKALEDVKKAQEALNGTTSAAATATQSATAAHNSYTAALRGASSAMSDAATVGNTYATSLQYINGQWMQLGGHAADATNATSAFATSLQIVGGQLQNIGKTAADATSTGLDPFATELQVINGQFVNLTGSSAAAAAGISNVGTAAKSAASAVTSLGAELDKTMNAQIADIQVSLQQGQTYQDRIGQSFWLGGLGSTLAPGENPTETLTKIFGGSPLSGAGKFSGDSTAASSTATAQAATAVSNAMVNAINDAMAANALEAAAQAQIGTDAYAALKATADQAVAAAGAAITAAEGQTTATKAQTTATAAAASSTAALAAVVTSAGSTIQAAATGVAAVTAAVAQFVTPILGPGQGIGGNANITALSSGVPTIGSGTAGGIGNGLKPATAFATNVIVNLNAGTVVGQGGMQQLSTMVGGEIVQQLSRLGIRLNRQ